MKITLGQIDRKSSKSCFYYYGEIWNDKNWKYDLFAVSGFDKWKIVTTDDCLLFGLFVQDWQIKSNVYSFYFWLL